MGDLLTSSIGQMVNVDTRLERSLWPSLVDPTQLELVLPDLAINARDAMPTGGRLTIETRNQQGAAGRDLQAKLKIPLVSDAVYRGRDVEKDS